MEPQNSSSKNNINIPTTQNSPTSHESIGITQSTDNHQLMEQNILNPSSLVLPSSEFEMIGDAASLWDTLSFPQVHHDLIDTSTSTGFMSMSPVRNNFASPTTSTYHKYNIDGHAMLGQDNSTFSDSFCCCSSSSSTFRQHISQLGDHFSTTHKLKAQSPHQNLLNSSPTNINIITNDYNINDTNITMPIILENISLTSLDDNANDHLVLSPHVVSSQTPMVSTFDETLGCFPSPDPSNFYGSVVSGIPSTQESSDGVYDQIHGFITDGTIESILPQQLQQENQQENTIGMREHDKNLSHALMLPPLPLMGSYQERDGGLQLLHLLLAYAESIAKEDYMLARRCLHNLNRVVSPLGDSTQRVASFFTEALTARLASQIAATKPSNDIIAKPLKYSFTQNSVEIQNVHQILYQACPYIKFAHFMANQAIYEAFEGEERVHVIDLNICQGFQWPSFIQALAARGNGPPFLRITGVGSCMESIEEIGRGLTELANSLHVPFEFHAIAETLENLKPHMFNRRVGEALAVNALNRIHRIPVNRIGTLLAMIRDQAPNIVTLVEREANHNGPYFLGRFLEALHYYSAIFDSLDATFPLDSSQRAKVEQHIFGPEIKNIVACEGMERIERHERLVKWRMIMEGKGFKGVPLSQNALTQSKVFLCMYRSNVSSDSGGYRLVEENGCLLLGWQDRPILSVSSWRC